MAFLLHSYLTSSKSKAKQVKISNVATTKVRGENTARVTTNHVGVQAMVVGNPVTMDGVL